MDSYPESPGSPPLPAPDTEVSVPKGDIPAEDLDFLELNPDLSANSVTPGGFIVEEVSPGKMEADDNESNATPHIYDKREDFEPTIIPSPAMQGSGDGVWTRHRRLSNAQQSKFINYLDDRFLQIRRRFVQSHGLNEGHGYQTLGELLEDLKQLVDFVWLSIEPQNAPILTLDSYKELSPPLFGQVDYLITIANDLLDYLERLETNDSETGVQLLKLVDSLDSKFARLLDGTIPGGKTMSVTESVRLTAIAERSRVAVANMFEKQQIEGFHYELSKIYERTLDRTT